MAAFKSELFSIEDVLNFYEQHENSNFRIFAGNKPEAAYCRFEYLDGNKQIGAETLYNALLALKQNVQNTNQYLLQIINKSKKLKDNIKAIDFVNVTFQLNNSEIQPLQHGQMVAGINQTHQLEAMYERIIKEQKEKLALMEARIAELEESEEEEEQPNENNFIGSIMQNEQIQGLLIGALTKFLTPNNNTMSKPTGINGIDINSTDNDFKISAAIEILKNHDISLGDDLLKLANIAESNPKQFSMLLSMLRSF